MGNNIQNQTNQMFNSIQGIVGNIREISVEKQQVDLAYQINEDKKAYNNFLNELEQNEADYEKINDRFNAFSAKQKAQGAKNLSGPWAKRQYELQSAQMETSYSNAAQGVYSRLLVKDGKTKAQSMFEDQVSAVGYQKESFTNDKLLLNSTIDASQFWTPGEKEVLKKEYGDKMLHNAVTAGYTAVFNETEGTYSEKAKAAEQFVLDQDLGELTAEQTENFFSSIRLLENSEYTREKRFQGEMDDDLDQSFWGYVKDNDILGLKEAFERDKFYDPDRNKYWYNFLNSLMDEAAGGGSSASNSKEKKNWMDQQIFEIRMGVENGDITKEQGTYLSEQLNANWGADPDVGDATRDFMDYMRKPELSDNAAYKYGEEYLKTMIKNMELEEKHPSLAATIQEQLRNYALDEGNNMFQTEQKYRELVDSLLMEPMIKNLNDTIRHKAGDEWILNTSEEITQLFQNGNLAATLRVDDQGNIDTDYYKEWIKAWGYDGKYENIDAFLETYMKDFGEATMRDFGSGAMIHFDKKTKRPMVEKDGEIYVLQIVDADEKRRLKGLDINANKNDESWYRWDREKGEYVYYQGVGK